MDCSFDSGIPPTIDYSNVEVEYVGDSDEEEGLLIENLERKFECFFFFLK